MEITTSGMTYLPFQQKSTSAQQTVISCNVGTLYTMIIFAAYLFQMIDSIINRKGFSEQFLARLGNEGGKLVMDEGDIVKQPEYR